MSGGAYVRIRSISHAGLTVRDFEKAVKWYYDMFGLRLVSEQVLEKEQVEMLYPLYGIHNTRIRLGFLRAPKGGVIEIFEFTPVLDAQKTVWNRPGLTHFALDVKNVNKWYNTLKEKGVYFFSGPQNTDGTDWVFLKDPDGNLIELIDLKGNYSALRLLGGIVGRVMVRGKFKNYYMETGYGR